MTGSFGIGGGKSRSKSQQSSESNPLTAGEVREYYDMIDGLTGNRLGDFAQNGTSEVGYTPLTAAELQAIGGAGETRRNALNRNLDNQQEQINNNSSLTVAQRMRSNQMANEAYNGDMDAINKEVEAAMSAMAAQENQSQYNAALRNSDLTREDMETIASIFFGGKGQKSESQGTGSSSAWNFSTNASVGMKG